MGSKYMLCKDCIHSRVCMIRDQTDFLPEHRKCFINKADAIETVYGQWIYYERPHYFKCSICKETVPYKKAMIFNGEREYNFCPKCGAKMKY